MHQSEIHFLKQENANLQEQVAKSAATHAAAERKIATLQVERQTLRADIEFVLDKLVEKLADNEADIASKLMVSKFGGRTG